MIIVGKNEKGFSIIEVIVLIFIVFVIIVVGINLAIKHSDSDKSKTIATNSLAAEQVTTNKVNSMIADFKKAGLSETVSPIISTENYCYHSIQPNDDLFAHTGCYFVENAYIFFSNSYSGSSTAVAKLLQQNNYFGDTSAKPDNIQSKLNENCIYIGFNVGANEDSYQSSPLLIGMDFGPFSLISFDNASISGGANCYFTKPLSQLPTAANVNFTKEEPISINEMLNNAKNAGANSEVQIQIKDNYYYK